MLSWITLCTKCIPILLVYFYASYYCYDVHGRMGALQE